MIIACPEGKLAADYRREDVCSGVDQHTERGSELLSHRGMAVRLVARVAGLAVVAAGLVVAPAVVVSSSALSGSDFDPGNIISDSLFYDSSAMTESQIQTFLNSQIAACGNTSCLNVLTTTVLSRPAEYSTTTGGLICDQFDGGDLSAAAIIYRAQVACNISAKVILVTLQKEQGLVTNTAPSESKLARAMGMACPDTAPCAAYALGFGNQVYLGARQLNVYKVARFARQPGVQSVPYNPSASCGSSTVDVKNYATAALYSYTPYQPNAAALANLGGIGDGCSSYGNRNFWVFYNNWFGPTSGNLISSTDNEAQVTAVTADGDLWVHQADGKGSWRTAKKIGNGWGNYTSVFGAGDFDGDGHRDILALDSSGTLWIQRTDGAAGWLTPPTQVNGNWSGYTALFSVGDFNEDGYQDLVSRDAAGNLYLHAGIGKGQVAPPVQIGNGWGDMTAIFGAGDFSGDGHADIIGRFSNGDLWLYRGNGRGGWLQPSKIGNGWSGMTALTSPGDFNGDGYPDVLARDSSGNLILFAGNGKAGWLPSRQIGVGWGGLSMISGPGDPANKVIADKPGSGDLNGDGTRDILAMSTSGDLWLYPGNGTGLWAASTPTKIAGAWSPGDLTTWAGDLNGDGKREILTLGSDGVLWKRSYDQTSGFAAPIEVSNAWTGINLIIGAGDITRDHIPDVLARDTSGLLWLYAGDGKGGFLPRKQVGYGWGSMTAIFNPGDFNGDGIPDLVARTAPGDLWLYPGDGNGGWGAARKIGNGWGEMTALFSPGDFDGDGKPDVIARDASGALILYRGDGHGGWLYPSRIGYGWDGFQWVDWGGTRARR